MATILRAIVGYFILLLVVRILKRRAGSQMTLFEFVLIFLMGGVIIVSTVGEDRSVTNCTCAVIAVSFIHRMLGWLKSKSPQVGKLLDGTPIVAIRKGNWRPEVAREARVRHEDVEAAARSMGLTRMEEVDYAILERNGRISVIKKED